MRVDQEPGTTPSTPGTRKDCGAGVVRDRDGEGGGRWSVLGGERGGGRRGERQRAEPTLASRLVCKISRKDQCKSALPARRVLVDALFLNTFVREAA